MKPELQIKALAELDGWTMHKVYPHVMCYHEGKRLVHESNIEAPRLSRYLTSYDAIIPLIQRQSFMMRNQMLDFLQDEMIEGYDGSDYISITSVSMLLLATPRSTLRSAPSRNRKVD